MKRFRMLAAAGVAVAVALSSAALAAGLWSTLPIIGGAAYCTGTVSGTGNLSGTTGQGQGTLGSICGLNEPAGPATFAGTEMLPLDLLTPGSQSAGPTTSAIINITQLGQGPQVDNTTAGAATIPNQTPWYFLDAVQASVTITMPSQPIQGQIQRVVCTTAVTTALTMAGNTGQSGKPAFSSLGACAAGQGFAWVYNAANTTWYRIQ